MTRRGAHEPRGVPGAALPSLVWNVGVNVTSQAFLLVATVATLPLLVHTLGSERYGILNLVTVVMAYLSTLDLGLSRAAVRWVADALGRGDDNDVRQVHRLSFLGTAVLAAAGAIGLAVLAGPLARALAQTGAQAFETEAGLRAAALAVAAQLIGQTLVGSLEGAQRFDLVNAIRVPSLLLNIAIPLIGALVGAGLGGIVGALAVKNVLVALGCLVLCHRILPKVRGRSLGDAHVLKAMLTYGAWASLHQLVFMLIGSGDRLVVGFVLGLGAVTFYAVPQQIVAAASALVYSARVVLCARFSRLRAHPQEATDNLHRRALEGLLLATAGAAFVLGSAGREILVLWMGAEFSRSGPVLEIAALGLVFFAAGSTSSELLQASGHMSTLVAISVAILSLQAALLWILVAPYGLYGAASAYTVAQLAGAAAFLWTVKARGLVRLRVRPRVLLLVATALILMVFFLEAKRMLNLPLEIVFPAAATIGLLWLATVWKLVVSAEIREMQKERSGMPPLPSATDCP